MSTVLDEFIGSFAARVGVARACRAFGTPARSFRYRQQRARRVAERAAAAASARENAESSGSDARHDGSSDTVNDVVSDAVDDPQGVSASDEGNDAAGDAAGGAVAVVRRTHPAALSSDERVEILEVLCSERFVDLSPHQVFMTLLDERRYLCSVRSMYRLLEEHGLGGDRRRGAHQSPGRHPMPIVQASRPNECWSWDITKLRGPVKGVLYYLYTILDIFSRKVVAWTIAERESASVAEQLIRCAIEREGVERDQLTLHADRGGPMIAGDIAELLTGLGVSKSHSRPRVSNDNPYSEAQFKTLKYRPDYPARFESIDAARDWCRDFFTWYNHTHYHSGIAYLRPADLHAGRHPEIIEQRQATLDQAQERHPQRFRSRPRAKTPPKHAWINNPVIQTS